MKTAYGALIKHNVAQMVNNHKEKSFQLIMKDKGIRRCLYVPVCKFIHAYRQALKYGYTFFFVSLKKHSCSAFICFIHTGSFINVRRKYVCLCVNNR